MQIFILSWKRSYASTIMLQKLLCTNNMLQLLLTCESMVKHREPHLLHRAHISNYEHFMHCMGPERRVGKNQYFWAVVVLFYPDMCFYSPSPHPFPLNILKKKRERNLLKSSSSCPEEMVQPPTRVLLHHSE